MRLNRIVARGAAAALFLGAFVIGVFAAAAQPAMCPPPFAGAAHPWIAALLMAGILAGAVFFRSPRTQAPAWACALAFGAFEAGFAAPLMRLSGGPPALAERLDHAVLGASLASLGFLVLSLPLLLSPQDSSGRRRRGVV